MKQENLKTAWEHSQEPGLLCRNKLLALTIKYAKAYIIKVFRYSLTLLDFLIFIELSCVGLK